MTIKNKLERFIDFICINFIALSIWILFVCSLVITIHVYNLGIEPRASVWVLGYILFIKCWILIRILEQIDDALFLLIGGMWLLEFLVIVSYQCVLHIHG